MAGLVLIILEGHFVIDDSALNHDAFEDGCRGRDGKIKHKQAYQMNSDMDKP